MWETAGAEEQMCQIVECGGVDVHVWPFCVLLYCCLFCLQSLEKQEVMGLAPQAGLCL